MAAARASRGAVRRYPFAGRHGWKAAVVLAAWLVAALARCGPAQQPTPTATPQPSPTPTPLASRPAAAGRAVKKPPPRVLSLGGPDAPPPATRPPLGSLATVKSPSNGRLVLSDENLFSATPIKPATREEYGVLLLGIANARRSLEETALTMLREVTNKPEVGRDDAWAQRLCSLAGRLSESTAMVAAITAPDDLLAVHADLVTVCRGFDRAVGLVCSEPGSAIAVDAANETLQDAAKKALAIFETVGRALGSRNTPTQ